MFFAVFCPTRTEAETRSLPALIAVLPLFPQRSLIPQLQELPQYANSKIRVDIYVAVSPMISLRIRSVE
jgi:hypothetical protein